MKSRLLLLVLVLLAVGTPAEAVALGLGDADVQSRLNQPLNARIPVLAGAADDPNDLSVALAPREAYERQGLERSAFLGNLTFRVVRDPAGRAAVEVRSTQPVTEPFLTFLLAIDWSRGHLVREYTLLLDPPVFEAVPSAPAPVVAPASGLSGNAAGAVDRTQPPAAAVADPPTPVEHRVQAGETLSAVVRAQGYSSATDVNRALVATFRANPSAFDGNINRLHRGALLRLPPKSEWSRLGVDEATAEVRRQVGEWKQNPAPSHLRLVVPRAGAAAAPDGTPAPARRTGPSPASDEVMAARRLLELKNAELARLETELANARREAQLATERAARSRTPPPVSAPAPLPPPPAHAATAPTAPAAAAAPVPAPARKHSSTVTPIAEPSLTDALLDNALTFVGGAVGLLLLTLAGLKWRARRLAAAADGATSAHDDHERPIAFERDALDGGAGRPAASVPFFDRAPAESAASVGTEPASFNALRTQAIPHSATPDRPPLDSRLGAESSITLHHLDPIAEADFHLAYGLYGQAADLLKLAIDLNPSRTDLVLKLLEVHFVAGDAAAFLAAARGLDRNAVAPADWDRLAVMGRQLAPDDPRYSARPAQAPVVDLDLGTDAAEEGLDLDLDLDLALSGGDTLPSNGALADAPSDFHLELEQELLDLSATLDSGPRPLDEAFDEPSSAVPVASVRGAHTPVPEATAELDLDDLALPDGPLGAFPPALPAVDLTAADPDAPTRLMPSLGDSDADGATRRMPSIADRLLSGDSGESAEDLLAEAARLLEDHWSLPPGMPPLPDAAEPDVGTPAAMEDIVLAEVNDDSIHPTASVPVVRPSAPPEAEPNPDPRSSLAGLRIDELNLGDEPLEFDLDDLARALQDDTLAQPGPARDRFVSDLVATGLHVQPDAVHAARMDLLLDDDVSRSRHEEFDLPDLDPVTLSEVGTKLDLARAYLDMSDPEGARAILDEVMAEGSPSQKAEAQRILETLPG